jgi:hypothetical protein
LPQGLRSRLCDLLRASTGASAGEGAFRLPTRNSSARGGAQFRDPPCPSRRRRGLDALGHSRGDRRAPEVARA